MTTRRCSPALRLALLPAFLLPLAAVGAGPDAGAPQPRQPMNDVLREPAAAAQATPPSEPPALPPQNTQALPPGVTKGAEQSFSALDRDHDGLLDRDEASRSTVLGAQFATLDSNADGHLSMAEFSAASNLASIRLDRQDRDE
jgi:hypothetical protein